MADDPKSTPLARANRLKRLRNLANLTRIELCELGKLNVNTLKGWEVARFGGISKVGAKKVIETLKSAGIICSVDWLLYEIGHPPEVVSFSEKVDSSLDDEAISSNTHKQYMIDELIVFREHYKKSLDLQIPDDSSEPTYCKGDLVAGRIIQDVKKCFGKVCLVQEENGLISVRLVHKSIKKNCLNLSSINPETSISEPIKYDVKVLAVAPIIWHRRPTA